MPHLGYYLYIETSDLFVPDDYVSWAALTSQLYDFTSSSCVFSFYYHMIGEASGGLDVAAIDEASGDVLFAWSRDGRQPDEWVRGGLAIGGIDAPFRIVINATHVGGGYTGDTAIDDLEFVNCDPGEKRRVLSRDSL